MLRPLLILLILLLPVPVGAATPAGFIALAYHNVQSRPGDMSAGDPPSM